MACVSGLFDTYDEAYDALVAIREAGAEPEQLSLITNNTTLPDSRSSAESVIASLPGIGEVAVIGWITAALAGTAGSPHTSPPTSLAAALQGNELSERLAETYSEALRRGSTLLLVRCAETDVAKVEAMLDDWGTVKIDELRDRYIAEGWIAFDQTVQPLTLEDIERGRRVRGLS
ncbi:hypothetical protein [Brucella pituitosa]|uniref:hypothetical protein n=1 Tax=Brucella pituitosa TaxID=571256 RepID=UPI0012601B42|nr:hypothetical protein [Brucella pituitosa]